MDESGPQLEFSLWAEKSQGPTGLDRWRADRDAALRDLGGRLGFPLSHRVEVVLHDGTCLRGVLKLANEELWIEARRDLHVVLQIDRCTFAAEDIESCVRLD